jgi:hypothetical protein
MRTLTVTSKSGTEFTLTQTATGIDGSAKGFNLGSMRLDSATIAAQFASNIGGKMAKISAELDAHNSKLAAELFAESDRMIDDRAADLDDYNARSARIRATE